MSVYILLIHPVLAVLIIVVVFVNYQRKRNETEAKELNQLINEIIGEA